MVKLSARRTYCFSSENHHSSRRVVLVVGLAKRCRTEIIAQPYGRKRLAKMKRRLNLGDKIAKDLQCSLGESLLGKLCHEHLSVWSIGLGPGKLSGHFSHQQERGGISHVLHALPYAIVGW